MFGPVNNLESKYERRREVVFLILAGVFLGSLAMLNILGISRFIDLSFNIGSLKVPFVFAVGVLAYPVTFLCTDFISELFGRRRANLVVWIGLLLNLWVIFVLWLGSALPPVNHLVDILISYKELHQSFEVINSFTAQYPEITNNTLQNGIKMIDQLTLHNHAFNIDSIEHQVQRIDTIVSLFPEFQNLKFADGIRTIDSIASYSGGVSYNNLPPIPSMDNYTHSDWAYFRIKQLTFGAVLASMVAYLTAQFVDVHVFHWLKNLTKGRSRWIRNNFSTMISQMVDTIAVTCITHFYAHALPIDKTLPLVPQLMVYIISAYVFKMTTALVDTVPFYWGTNFLSRYLNIQTSYNKNTEQEKHE